MTTEDRDGLLRVVGGRVRALRLAQGLSQEALADAADLHRTYIGSLERGERNVSVLNIYRLARTLRVEPGDLLPGWGVVTEGRAEVTTQQ